MKYEYSSPTLPRNLASLGCCAVCHVPCGAISCLAWRHSWKEKPAPVSLFKLTQPLLCPGKNKSAPKEGVSGWARACAPCWVLPPWGHVPEVWAAPLPEEKMPLGSLAQVTSVCQTTLMHFPLADDFWEFISALVRGGFTPSPVVLQSLFQVSSVLSHSGFLQSVCVPKAWRARGCCSSGRGDEAVSLPLPLCVPSCVLRPGTQTHLITGTVWAKGKLVVFFQMWL